MERYLAATLTVIKRDGSREDFSRDKILNGVLRACTRRPVTMEAIDRLVEGVERDARRHGRTEIPTAAIGQMVMERLRVLDRVAYLRFASVYRNFQTVENFVQEAQELLTTEQGDFFPRGARRAPLDELPETQLPLPLDPTANGVGRDRGKRRAVAAAG
jgi:transcriptional repressor NrdR